jgi:hypothetical protein
MAATRMLVYNYIQQLVNVPTTILKVGASFRWSNLTHFEPILCLGLEVLVYHVLFDFQPRVPYISISTGMSHACLLSGAAYLISASCSLHLSLPFNNQAHL